MKKSFTAILMCFSISAIAQTKERIQFIKTYFECSFCKRHYLVPDYVPDISKIKNDVIREQLSSRLLVVGVFLESQIRPVRKSRCNSAQSRNGQHEWVDIESKSLKKFLVATIKQDNSVEVPGW